MNELPVESVKLQTSETQTVNALLIASRGLSPFRWHGQDWGVLTLDHSFWSDKVRAELVPWPFDPDSPVECIASVPSNDPPPAPARHCSCGKPATRGGLCGAEPAAPVSDSNARRQAFELWVVGAKVDDPQFFGAKLTQCPDGSYADYRINDRWVAWNAALDTMGVR